MQVHEFARPFHGGDGPVAVLFCHGFTATPGTLRDWARYTADAGFTVSLPRLPGHGTTWQELGVTDWRDWFACLDREFNLLRRRCDQVFLAGMSMGGALALRIAELYPDAVSGLVLVNPAVAGNPGLAGVGIARHLVRSISVVGSDIKRPGVLEHSYPRVPLSAAFSMTRMWADVRARLDLVYCPLLLFRSSVDHRIPAVSSEVILRQVSSEEITERVLPNSYHVATRDNDASQILTESVAFFARHTSP